MLGNVLIITKCPLIAVQSVAAPSELGGDIPLVAHVLETHGAPFKMQILLLKHKYWTDRQTLYWTRHLELNIILNVWRNLRSWWEIYTKYLRNLNFKLDVLFYLNFANILFAFVRY